MQRRHGRFTVFALMLLTGMAAFAGESRQRLQLTLAYEEGPPVLISIHEGEVARIQHPASGLAFRLKAAYDPIERNAVVTFYDAAGNRDDETSTIDTALTSEAALTAVNIPLAAEAVRVSEGKSKSASGARLASLQVGFTGFAAARKARKDCAGSGLAGTGDSGPLTDMRPQSCCVPCNGWEFCGCAVEACKTTCCVSVCC